MYLTTTHVAYVALGSNLQSPIQQVRRALRALEALPETKLEKHSSLYRSAPLGLRNQPYYINAVALLKTRLTPKRLLIYLQNIENKQGRIRTVRWGARTLDLDLLLYNNRRLKDSLLTLPHPGLLKRAFVLHPLCECTPTLILPNGKELVEFIKFYSKGGLKKLG